jgi:hypothetical protein
MNVRLIADLYNDQPVTPPPGPPTQPREEVLDAVPVEPPPIEADEHSVLGLTELLLKQPARVDRLTREEGRPPELIPRFLAIAVASFGLFSLALVILLNAVNRSALPGFLRERWSHAAAPAVSLWLAYTLGLIAATGICLPSFYFQGLLAGVRMSVLQVTTHVLKGKAATSIMLLGLLPVYFAVMLGLIVFGADRDLLEACLYAGLGLPILAGLWGTQNIYEGVMALTDTLPPERRCARGCFLRRLVLAWAACYTAVTPVMIYKLWEYFSGVLG